MRQIRTVATSRRTRTKKTWQPDEQRCTTKLASFHTRHGKWSGRVPRTIQQSGQTHLGYRNQRNGRIMKARRSSSFDVMAQSGRALLRSYLAAVRQAVDCDTRSISSVGLNGTRQSWISLRFCMTRYDKPEEVLNSHTNADWRQFQGGHVDGIPTDDSSEDDLESPTTVDRHGIEAGTLENPRVRQSARPGEHRVELPPATSPNFSCQGEQRDEQTSSKPPRNAKDFQVDSRLSNHTALDARCDADATSVERLAHTTDDQTQHTVENSANPADHARSCQPEYASDHREDFERMPWEGPGLPPVQAAHGGLSMPASQGLLGTGGAQPSPGIAFCSHFEDALGEGFDSWYGPIEAAVQGVESLPASASMSDWDAWLQQ